MGNYNFNLLSDRIKWLMSTKDISLSEVAKAAGVKPSSASAWIDGKSKNLRAENALNLSGKLKVSLSWLVTGKGSPEQEDIIIVPDNTDIDPSTEVQIKEFVIMFDNNHNKMPTFVESADSAPKKYPISLFKELNIEPSNCKRIKVKDDEMAPLLYKNDEVLIDILDVEHIETNGVYLLAINNETKIRRLMPLLKGGVIVKADNPEISQETLNKDEFEDIVKIMGKVVYRAGNGGL
ncbi:XRE family transcriptional regulator [Succinatimonas hippei]|uniref:XRE family transcriptional regulator n=1 Tax=Succinatimonas hippei TaxID=626938 RepID=UPI00255D11BD|nr:S24 family peptidase [Succinatimonas hippei]